MRRRIPIFVALASVGVASFCLLHLSLHRLVLRAYFSDAKNIHSDADVRLAGVKVGTVKAVRIQSGMKDAPAELTMVLDTRYGLRIPNDSVVELQTAGVLGETYAEIEIAGTSGPPSFHKCNSPEQRGGSTVPQSGDRAAKRGSRKVLEPRLDVMKWCDRWKRHRV